jgi:hypothetical protein
VTRYLVRRGISLYLTARGEVVSGKDNATRFPTQGRAEEVARKAGPGWRVVPLHKPTDTRTP